MSLLRSNKNKKFITNASISYYLDQNQKKQGITPSGQCRRGCHHLFRFIKYPSTPSPYVTMAKEEKSECISQNSRGIFLQRRTATPNGVTRVVLTLEGVIFRWGGARCIRGGNVGERSTLVGSACLSPCSIVLSAKSENRNGNCDRGCKGKSIPKKSSLNG